jgi:hypothetical protein
VFILNSSANAYWWYHSGWRVARECLNTKSYEQYTKFFEDLSHGALTLSLVLDYYNCLGLFSTADMVRFRNTFTKLLYNGDGTFNNAVNGADNPIFHNGNSDSEWPHNLLKMSSMAYMPFSRFDNLSTAPNVYNIIMNFYAGNVSNMAIPLNGMDGLPHKGHAETVKAQWERECPNLSLYNRDVVYHQDFFAKHNLVIEPQQSSGRSYADPVIHTPDFIVEPGVMANFTAGHEIVLKPGTVFKEGSYVIAAINPALCNAPSFALGNIQSDSIQNSFLDSTGNDTSIMIPVKMLVQTTPAPQAIKTEMEPTVALSPNPNNGTFTIETNFDPREITTVQIYNSLGQLAYSQAGLPQAVITVPGMSKGLFVIKITTATNQFIQKMVVQ